MYDRQGDYAKALEYYFKDLKISEKVLGKEHPDTATSYNNIAWVYRAQEQYALSLEYYTKALRIWDRIFGANHPDTLDVKESIDWVNTQLVKKNNE